MKMPKKYKLLILNSKWSKKLLRFQLILKLNNQMIRSICNSINNSINNLVIITKIFRNKFKKITFYKKANKKLIKILKSFKIKISTNK